MDMDIELKFSIGGTIFRIDVRKAFLEQLKDVYKALISIGKRQRADAICRDNVPLALQAMAGMYKIGQVPSPEAISAQFHDLLKNFNAAVLVNYTKRDFSDVFSRYIQA